MRLRHWKYAILLTGLMAAPSLRAQFGGDGLTVYAGSAVFPDPAYDSLALVEFPFSLSRHQFEFFRPSAPDSFLYARIFAQVDLLNAAGMSVDSASTYFSVRVADEAQAAQPDIRLFNKLRLFARPGVYTARLTVYDVVSKRSGTVYLESVVVEPAERERISLGGPMMAYQAYPVKDTTAVNMRLVRNNFMVLPNPVGVFSTQDTLMYCFGEVYNLGADADSNRFQLSFELLDARDSLLRSIGSHLAVQEDSTMAFGEPIDIRDWLPSGYRLRVIATDLKENVSDTASIPFAVIEPAVQGMAGQQATDADYFALTLDEQVRLIWYLLTPAQRETLERLSPDGKRTYLAQYWSEHDSDPATAVNEGRSELVRRFRYVNLRYSLNEAKDDGWMTDRGRIYLTYGPYDEIDDRNVPVSGEPYQIWYYRAVKEGKVFVFVDQHGNHEYRLVHSNVYGEIYDSDWAATLDAGFPEFDTDM